MTILITGGTGLIGGRLSEILISNGFLVKLLSRFPEKYPNNANVFKWDINKGIIDIKAFENVSVIIHLAGENIGSKRWTKKRKEKILISRLKSLNLLLQTIVNFNISIDTFIYSSAIGYYGTYTTEKIFKEEDIHGDDFLADVCYNCEKTALEFQNKNIRTVLIRTGIVLSNKGGALKKMVKPTKLGINAPLGLGTQYMPWIHIDDLCQIYINAIENNLFIGAYNAVSPNICTNFDFSKTLSEILKKPFFLPNIPSICLKIIFGEMSSVLLYGSRISSEKLINTGFNFQYSKLYDALNNLLIKKK